MNTGKTKTQIIQKAALAAVAATVFFGVSVVVDHTPRRQSDHTAGSAHVSVPRVDVQGLQKLMAATFDVDSQAAGWDGVRGSATFIREITEALNTSMEEWQTQGLFKFDGEHTKTNADGSSYRIRGGSTVTVDGLLGQKEYSYSLETWNAAGDKTYEIFMDNPDNPKSSGILVRFSPTNSGETSHATGAMFECQAGTNTSTESGEMVCGSWSGAANTAYNSTSGDSWDAMLIEVKEENAAGARLEVAITARLAAQDAVCNDSDSSDDYWAIAYIAETVSPYESTAVRGGYENTITTNPAYCGTDTAAGFFNTDDYPDANYKYLHEVSYSNQEGYPTIEDVETIFGSLVTTGSSLAGQGELDTLNISWHRDATKPF